MGTARPTAAEFLQQKQGVLAPFGPVQTQEELQLFTGLLTEQLQRGGALDWDNLTLKFNEVVTERIKGGDATAKELRLKSVNACMAMYDKMNDQAQLRDMMQPHLEQFKALRSALKADDSVAHSAPAALPAPKRMRQEASAPGPPAGAAVAPSLHVALPPHGPQLPGLPPPQRQQSLAEEIAGAPGKAVRTIVLEQIVTRMYGSKEKTAGQTSAIVDAFNTAVIDAGRQDCKARRCAHTACARGASQPPHERPAQREAREAYAWGIDSYARGYKRAQYPRSAALHPLPLMLARAACARCLPTPATCRHEAPTSHLHPACPTAGGLCVRGAEAAALAGGRPEHA